MIANTDASKFDPQAYNGEHCQLWAALAEGTASIESASEAERAFTARPEALESRA